MISFILSVLFFGILILFFIPNYKLNLLKILSLNISFIILVLSLFLWLKFNNNFNGFQELEYYYFNIFTFKI